MTNAFVFDVALAVARAMKPGREADNAIHREVMHQEAFTNTPAYTRSRDAALDVMRAVMHEHGTQPIIGAALELGIIHQDDPVPYGTIRLMAANALELCRACYLAASRSEKQ